MSSSTKSLKSLSVKSTPYLLLGNGQVSKTLHIVFLDLFKLILGLIPKRSVTVCTYSVTRRSQLKIRSKTDNANKTRERILGLKKL